MNNLIEVKELKMTSLDIAEITGKRHDHVIRDIRQEIEKLKDITVPIFGESEYKDSTGRKLPCYEFGKKGAMQLALKYDAVIRYKVICKIEELENKNKAKNNLPQNFAQALRLAAEQAELIEAQKQIISEAKPKLDYVDRILNSKSLLTVTQIAKDYGLSGNKLNSILHEQGIQYKQSSQWLLYQKYSSKSYTQSETIEFKDKKGNTRVTLNTKWTTKGRIFIHELLNKLDIHPNVDLLD